MYKIVYEKRVLKDLDKISNTDVKKIIDVFNKLTLNPTPNGIKKLSGEVGLYRVRQGDYRIIYTIEHNKKEVKVVMVGNRKEAYRSLKSL